VRQRRKINVTIFEKVKSTKQKLTASLKFFMSKPAKKKANINIVNRRISTNNALYDLTRVARNDKGGVLVTPEEIEAAFEFFDLDGSGKITMGNLKKRLSVFYKNMPNKEFRFLMNNKPEMTKEELTALLIDNEVQNFDPVGEFHFISSPLAL
tara:strand:+ start:27 stop:485 length:459 start_codon:yes stop_codon:yes gene_type:complete